MKKHREIITITVESDYGIAEELIQAINQAVEFWEGVTICEVNHAPVNKTPQTD
jgi:hypothetical protein